MPAVLLPNQILSLTAEAADRLLKEANGDAALFYLALLRHGGTDRASGALGWSEQRAAAALESLVKLSLAEGNISPQNPAETVESIPTYQRSDLAAALRDDGNFRALSLAMEKVLGKPLSDADLQSLYTVYDYLGLPAEVIYLVARWCSEETARQHGAGRPPRMPMIKKEAFRWKRLGVDTLAAAEEFLAKQEVLVGREREILPLLGITGRAPVERERQYIAGWVDMGFEDDAIRLAYERTVVQKGSLNWAYLNSILKNWHAAGLHTAEQAEKEDRPPRNNPIYRNTSSDNYQPSVERIRKNADWLDGFIAQRKQKKEG